MVGRASVRRARHKQKLESKDIRHWKAKKPLRYSLNASKIQHRNKYTRINKYSIKEGSRHPTLDGWINEVPAFS